MMDHLSLLSLTLILLFIMDPVGNLTAFLTMTQNLSPKRQKLVIIREMFFALFFILLFNFAGEFLLAYLNLSPISLRFSAGIILFLVAIKIIFPTENNLLSHLSSEEPFLVPLAIPLIAGPSLLAIIMLFANLD